MASGHGQLQQSHCVRVDWPVFNLAERHFVAHLKRQNYDFFSHEILVDKNRK